MRKCKEFIIELIENSDKFEVSIDGKIYTRYCIKNNKNVFIEIHNNEILSIDTNITGRVRSIANYDKNPELFMEIFNEIYFK